MDPHVFHDSTVGDMIKLSNDMNNTNKTYSKTQAIKSLTQKAKKRGQPKQQKRPTPAQEESLFSKIEVDYSVKVYCQEAFKLIRSIDGVDDNDIMSSMDPKNNRCQIFKTNSGQKHNDGGKSGNFFFFS